MNALACIVLSVTFAYMIVQVQKISGFSAQTVLARRFRVCL